MSTYNSSQIYFCLNILSNISAEYNNQADIKTQTQTAVSKVLQDSTGVIQGLIGNWVPVWGPVVYVVNGCASNTMFIAQNTDTNEYVVSIAGTDPRSFFDWLLEDALVGKKIQWDLTNKSCGSVSWGTEMGITTLKTMTWTDPKTQKSNTALSYLQSVNAQKITVTGHSLGGALSPAMALFLNNNMGNGAKVSCRPTAGPTPGDATFAAYWNGIFQNDANTVRVWNQLDVVPNAYEQDTMENIPNLYLPTITCPLTKQIDNEAEKLGPLGYTQLLKSTATSFNLGVYNQGQQSDPFGMQALYQHVAAYAQFFNIPAYQNQVQQLLGLSKPYFTGGIVNQTVAAEAAV